MFSSNKSINSWLDQSLRIADSDKNANSEKVLENNKEFNINQKILQFLIFLMPNLWHNELICSTNNGRSI